MTNVVIEYVKDLEDAGYRTVRNSARVEDGMHVKVDTRKCMEGEFTAGGFYAVNIDKGTEVFFAGNTAQEALQKIDGYTRSFAGADTVLDGVKIKGTVRTVQFGGMAHVRIANRKQLQDIASGLLDNYGNPIRKARRSKLQRAFDAIGAFPTVHRASQLACASH